MNTQSCLPKKKREKNIMFCVSKRHKQKIFKSFDRSFYKLKFLSNWSPEKGKVKDKESLSRGIMTHSTNGFKQIKTKPVQACAIDI